MKRLTDIVVSALGLVITSPVLLVVAILLRRRHGSPVLFRQERVGREGETFQIHKFRTMDTRPGSTVTVGGDSRIHPLGAFLRAWKLDELPQLWDVLRGKMSLVGPRPEVPEYAAMWPPMDREVILSVRPGITDPASILFRNEADLLAAQQDPEDFYARRLLPQKCSHYVQYVSTRTWLTDVKIIVRTLREVIRPARA